MKYRGRKRSDCLRNFIIYDDVLISWKCRAKELKRVIIPKEE